MAFSKNLSNRCAVSALFLLQGLVFSSWASRIPAIKSALELNDAQLGTSLFALPLGQLSTMFFSGMMVSKFGSKFCTAIGSFMYPTVLILISYADSQLTLIGALFLFGVSANINNIAINTQAVSLEHLYGRSIMGSLHGVWSLAGFFGGLIGTAAIANSVSVRGHFVCVSILIYAVYLAARPFLLPSDFSNTGDDDPSQRGKTRGYLRPTPYIVTLGLIAFGSMSCEGTMFDWSGVYFKTVVRARPELVSLGFVCFMCTMAAGRFAADKFVMRFGPVRVIQASGLIIFSGMLISVLFPTVVAASAGFMLVGLGVSSVVPTAYSLVGKSRRMKIGVALSCVCTIGFFGFIFGPPIIGYVAQASSLRVSFMIMACIGLCLIFLAPLLRSRIEE